jgi:hypothetical protein
MLTRDNEEVEYESEKFECEEMRRLHILLWGRPWL